MMTSLMGGQEMINYLAGMGLMNFLAVRVKTILKVVTAMMFLLAG